MTRIFLSDLMNRGNLTIRRIPLPPSTNNLYSNVRGRGRVPTKQYKSWLSGAALVMNLAASREKFKMPPKTPFKVWLYVDIDRNRDLDNCIKPLLDCLSKTGITADDRYCDIIEVTRLPLPERKTCQVRIAY